MFQVDQYPGGRQQHGAAGISRSRPYHRKIELGRHLPNARIGRIGHHFKAVAVDQAGWGLELGVIVNVEELCPEFKRHRLMQREVPGYRHIPIVDAWAPEEAALGIAKLPQGLPE